MAFLYLIRVLKRVLFLSLKKFNKTLLLYRYVTAKDSTSVLWKQKKKKTENIYNV